VLNEKLLNKRHSAVALFVLIFSVFLLLSQSVNSQVSIIGPKIRISDDLSSSNVFNIFSPSQVCYNKSCVLLNFSLTGHSLGTIGYSLDNEDIQGLETFYGDANEDGYAPFLNFSDANQVTVRGGLAFENLSNGNHTLRLYLGHQCNTLFKVNAFTEVKFSVAAPIVLLIQGQDYYLSRDVPLELIVSEPTYLLCSIDNKTNQTINGNTTLTGLTSGYHNVTVYGCNDAGNWCTSNTINFEVSKNPTVTSSPDSPKINLDPQQNDFPFLTLLVFFVILICCMFPIIGYLEKRISGDETKK
jgi:hypothetical protein